MNGRYTALWPTSSPVTSGGAPWSWNHSSSRSDHSGFAHTSSPAQVSFASGSPTPVSTRVQPSSPGSKYACTCPGRVGSGKVTRRIPPSSWSMAPYATTLPSVEHMFYPGRGARRVPAGALQVRAQRGARHALPLVAQPVHGLRAPVHVLLRPPVRAARRPTVRRPLRPFDPRQDERGGGTAARARAALVAARGGRDRGRDRSVPARGGPIPADPCLPRRARGRLHPVLDRDARTVDRERPRRPRGRGAPRWGERVLLDPHARRAGLEDDRARN